MPGTDATPCDEGAPLRITAPDDFVHRVGSGVVTLFWGYTVVG